jgi:hypothetical protein
MPVRRQAPGSIVLFLLSRTAFGRTGYGKYVMKEEYGPLWFYRGTKMSLFYILSIVVIICSLYFKMRMGCLSLSVHLSLAA